MGKVKLSRHELDYIREREKAMMETINTLRNLSQFKEGDFLVAYKFAGSYGDYKKRPVTNSYGVPKKFIVVHVDSNGIPYMKELNKSGDATGPVLSPVRADGGYSIIKQAEYVFEIDPEYTDAIILDDQENFNATEVLKAKSDNFKEIAEHNKKLKVNCIDMKALAAFFGTVKVGDTLWRSNVSYYVVTKIDTVPRDKIGRLIKETNFLEVTSNKGTHLTFCLDDFWRTALYSAQPRSYRELKDPK